MRLERGLEALVIGMWAEFQSWVWVVGVAIGVEFRTWSGLVVELLSSLGVAAGYLVLTSQVADSLGLAVDSVSLA